MRHTNWEKTDTVFRGRKRSFTSTSSFAVWALAALALISLASYASLSLLPSPDASAVTTVPTKLNFQGRLTDSTGNIKPNGTYNMRFKLYTVATAGTSVWSEDRLVSATQGVTVTNGLFSVQLGSITSLPASLFASGALYLEVELPTPATATTSSPAWTEGPMTPRNQMATSAYAYNSETLDGQDGAWYQDASNLNAGTVSSSLLSGSYTGITGTGALSAGSITTGFGTIATGNTITGTTLTGTTAINTGAGAGTQRIDASGNLVNIGNLTGTGSVMVRAASTGTLTLDTTGAGTVTIGSTATTINLGTGTTAETVNIGNSTGVDTVNIATNSGNDVVNIGSATGAAAINLQSGTSAITLQGRSITINGVGVGTYDNFIDNPGFETGNEDQGWANSANFTLDSTDTHTGSYALSATSTGANFYYQHLVDLPTQPGDNWYGEVWMKSIGAAGQGSLRFGWYQSSGAVSAVTGNTYPGLAATTADTWTKLGGTATAPSDAAFLRIWIRVGSASTGVVHKIDDIYVKRETYLPELNIGGTNVISSTRVLQNVTADASILTSGTIVSARLVGSYTGITGTGALSAGSITSGFGTISTANTISGTRLISTVATGTAPLTVSSTTLVTNLNADFLDGQAGSFYQNAANLTGTISSARLSGAYSGITGVGTLSSLTVTGSVSTGTSLVIGQTANQQIVFYGGAVNHGIELGRTDGVSSTPFIDFHSYGSSTNDRDARIIASGGNGTAGTGTLEFEAATTRLTGNLDIGNISSGSGSAVCISSGGLLVKASGCSPSSIRYKENVVSLNDTLGVLGQLRPVSFDWKASTGKTASNGGVNDFGLIAEEVNEVLPEIVLHGEGGEIEGINYQLFTPFLIRAIQQQQSQIAQLQQATDLTNGGTINGSLAITDGLNVSGATTLANLAVTGNASFGGNLTVIGKLETSEILVNGHIVSGGEVPQITPVDGACFTTTIEGTDSAGTIRIVTTNDCSWEGELANILFTKAYAKSPRVVISPSNMKAAKSDYYKGSTASSGFSLHVGSPLQANSEYIFDYMTIE